MKKLIIALALASLSFAAQADRVIKGITTDGKYSFQAFGSDLVLYNGAKRLYHCRYDTTTRGIDKAEDPYVLDIYQCGNKTLGVKTFGDIEEGGWVTVIATVNNKPVTVFQESFAIFTGANSL